MKVTRSQLKKIIQEELDESFMEPGGFGVSHPKQKKIAPSPSVDDTEKRFIDSVIRHKYKALEYKEQQALAQRLAQVIDDAVAAELEGFQPTPLQEVAPPGKEDMVMALKKEMCGGKDDCPAAYGIAWAEKNKKKNK